MTCVEIMYLNTYIMSSPTVLVHIGRGCHVIRLRENVFAEPLLTNDRLLTFLKLAMDVSSRFTILAFSAFVLKYFLAK
jgi:hypothetical protein